MPSLPQTPRRHTTRPLPTWAAMAFAGLTALVGFLLGPGGPARAVSPDPVGRWPLRPSPDVVAGFEPPATMWGAGHRGVDLLGRTGEQVRAALAGRVVFAGRIAGRGVVVVDHGGTRTTYEPVHASLAWGSHVLRGEAIGTLELTGSHCFPRACLHWGWLRGTTYLDPLRLVGAGPVRLLPLGPRSLSGSRHAAYGRYSTTEGGGYRWLSSSRSERVETAWVTPWGAPARRPDGAGPW